MNYADLIYWTAENILAPLFVGAVLIMVERHMCKKKNTIGHVDHKSFMYSPKRIMCKQKRGAIRGYAL